MFTNNSQDPIKCLLSLQQGDRGAGFNPLEGERGGRLKNQGGACRGNYRKTTRIPFDGRGLNVLLPLGGTNSKSSCHDTNLQILTPRRYVKHPCHFFMEIPTPRGKLKLIKLSVINSLPWFS